MFVQQAEVAGAWHAVLGGGGQYNRYSNFYDYGGSLEFVSLSAAMTPGKMRCREVGFAFLTFFPPFFQLLKEAVEAPLMWGFRERTHRVPGPGSAHTTQLRKRLGLEVAVDALLANPTIAGMARQSAGVKAESCPAQGLNASNPPSLPLARGPETP